VLSRGDTRGDAW